MREFLDKIWKDPVWSKVISAGIIALCVWGWNMLSGGWVVSVLQTLWHWIKVLLCFEVAIYWVLIFTIAVMLICYIIWYIKQNQIPKHLSYRSGKINNYEYEWEYDEYDSPYLIQMVCPDCDTLMQPEHGFGYVNYSYQCPRCGQNVTAEASNIDVINIIKDNIRKDKYGTK